MDIRRNSGTEGDRYTASETETVRIGVRVSVRMRKIKRLSGCVSVYPHALIHSHTHMHHANIHIHKHKRTHKQQTTSAQSCTVHRTHKAHSYPQIPARGHPQAHAHTGKQLQTTHTRVCTQSCTNAKTHTHTLQHTTYAHTYTYRDLIRCQIV